MPATQVSPSSPLPTAACYLSLRPHVASPHLPLFRLLGLGRQVSPPPPHITNSYLLFKTHFQEALPDPEAPPGPLLPAFILILAATSLLPARLSRTQTSSGSSLYSSTKDEPGMWLNLKEGGITKSRWPLEPEED